MESDKTLIIDHDFMNHLKDVEKSFAVEADIRSGSMLIPDQQKLHSIMEKRVQAFDIVYLNPRVLTDNILAFEKVYAKESKDSMIINRVEDIINSFFLVKDSEAYKAKIDGLDCLIDDEGLPIDMGRKVLGTHLTWLEKKQFEPTDGRIVDFTKKPVDFSQNPAALFNSLRYALSERLELEYKSLQHHALNPEKEVAKSKEAGTELSP